MYEGGRRELWSVKNIIIHWPLHIIYVCRFSADSAQVLLCIVIKCCSYELALLPDDSDSFASFTVQFIGSKKNSSSLFPMHRVSKDMQWWCCVLPLRSRQINLIQELFLIAAFFYEIVVLYEDRHQMLFTTISLLLCRAWVIYIKGSKMSSIICHLHIH